MLPYSHAGRARLQVNPNFGALYRLVKLWAKAHDINDGAASTFNSHCLALLVCANRTLRENSGGCAD